MKRKGDAMKKLPYVLYALLAAAMIGLFLWDYLPDGYVERGTVTKFGLLLAAAVLGIIRTATGERKRVSNKKAVYSKAYPQFIGNAFSQEPKLEKRFYDAVDLFNRKKPAAAVAQLDKLRAECANTSDLYAVTVFQALCLDDMRLYDNAAKAYDAALRIRPNTTLASNLGLCLERMGRTEEAVEMFRQAISIDPANAFPRNNLAQHYIRAADYENAALYARQALEINPKMPQALNAMAVCSYVQGDREAYERYYRLAVSNGSNGDALKRFIQSLDPN